MNLDHVDQPGPLAPTELRAAADFVLELRGAGRGRLGPLAGRYVPDPDLTILEAAARRLADVIEYVEARDAVANYTVNDRLLRIARGEEE